PRQLALPVEFLFEILYVRPRKHNILSPRTLIDASFT
ncbi:hypothetical protein AXF05_08335, partial [Staphylococcus aureus]|nr:hypothetical protein [Staphylococcus aureus]